MAEDEAKLRELGDVRLVMSSPAGRRFLWRLIDSVAHVFSGSFSGDALSTAFAEGRRAVGIDVMREAQRASPEHYLSMLEEAQLASRLEALEREKRGTSEE